MSVGAARSSRVALVLACAALLSGCIPASPIDGTVPVVQMHDDLVPDIPPGTVVASGFFGTDGSPTGTVEITTTQDSGYQLRLLDVASTPENPSEVLLNALPVGTDLRCADKRVVPVGQTTGIPTESIPLGDFHDFGQYDPTFLTEVVIAEFVQSDAAEDSCLRTVIARAALNWMFPVLRSELQVHDSGSVAGARGEIIREGDKVISYVVAPDDILSEILDRLGISLQEFLWLNPFGSSVMAYAGDVYNLDRDAR